MVSARVVQEIDESIEFVIVKDVLSKWNTISAEAIVKLLIVNLSMRTVDSKLAKNEG